MDSIKTYLFRGVLIVVLVLCGWSFLNSLTYVTARDPWAYLFASRQYAAYGPLWNDPIVQSLQGLEKSTAIDGSFSFFYGNYQWYYHGVSGFMMPWGFAWLAAGADAIFGLGASFWLPLFGAGIFFLSLGFLLKHTLGPKGAALALCLCLYYLVADPGGEAYRVLFHPYREPVALAFIFGAFSLFLSGKHFKKLPLFVCGLSFGLACLIRDQFVVVLPALLLAVAIRNRRYGLKQAGLALSLVMAGLTIGIACLVIQRPMESYLANLFWNSHPVFQGGHSVSLAFKASNAERLAEYFRFSPSMFFHYLDFIRNDLGWFGIIMALTGSFALAARSKWAELALLVGGAGSILALHSYWNQLSFRYALSMYVFLHPLVGIGAWHTLKLAHLVLSRMANRPLLLRRVGNIILILILGYLTIYSGRLIAHLQPYENIAVSRKEALQFASAISGMVSKDDIILINMSRHTTVFRSSGYWLEAHVVDPFSLDSDTQKVSRILVEDLLQSGKKVLLLTDISEKDRLKDDLYRWAEANWNLAIAGQVEFIGSFAVLQLQPSEAFPAAN